MMKKLMVFIFLIGAISVVAIASVTASLKQIEGEWSFEVPTAPYGYEKGTLIIEEKENQLAGAVKFSDGYKVDLKNLSFANDTFKCGLYVDYEYVSMVVKMKNGKMDGVVKTSEGELPVSAKKANGKK